MIEQILYTACVTPFDAEERVDYETLEKLLKRQEEVGNGIVLLGSTGEALSLTDDEKKDIVRFVCELKLNAQLIVGVPSHNLRAAIDWLDFCNPFPIDGYLMTTPIYTKPGILGQTKWFKTLLNLSKHPAMAYNIPGRACVKLYPETVKNLSTHPKLAAIKDSSGTVDSLVEYKIAAPNLPIYCGDDYLMPAMAAEGACGLISVASNAWPAAVRNYVSSALKREIIDDHKEWWQASKALFGASNPIPVKSLLKGIGCIKTDKVRLPLCQEDFSSLELLLSYNQIIQNLEGSHVK